ncbi:MAG: Gfo/Idh/MocA family oxidoreductase, partial [Ruminococcaceae bacterium]|nr:Gfo/Idh/MocA family oxidoreductase [Oscillospiraceae bacterium]
MLLKFLAICGIIFFIEILTRRKHSMKDIRIGLLGFGAMGKVHAYAVDTLPYFYGSLPFRAHVRSLCTTSHERAQGIAEQYGFDGAVRCEDEMINDPEIDVVDICTPNIYHYDTLLKALQAGKHVLCEKPLCVTAEQAAEVADLAKESGLVCGMVFNNR